MRFPTSALVALSATVAFSSHPVSLFTGAFVTPTLFSSKKKRLANNQAVVLQLAGNNNNSNNNDNNNDASQEIDTRQQRNWLESNDGITQRQDKEKQRLWRSKTNNGGGLGVSFIFCIQNEKSFESCCCILNGWLFLVALLCLLTNSLTCLLYFLPPSVTLFQQAFTAGALGLAGAIFFGGG